MNYTALNGSRWDIENVCPPIPTRAFDWEATHENYDGAPDAWDGKRKFVSAPTREALIERIEARCRCGLEREPGFVECEDCESTREADRREDISVERGS